MSKLSRRPGRRDRKARVPIVPKNHMRRLIVLIEKRNRAGGVLEAAKADNVSPETAAEAFDQLQEAQRDLDGYTSRGHGRQRFEPQFNRRAMRSKYQPHQGKRECFRRIAQGLAA